MGIINKDYIGQVSNMSGMFLRAKAYLICQGLQSSTSKVANMDDMFLDAVLFNQPMHKWHISSLKGCVEEEDDDEERTYLFYCYGLPAARHT
ncbi:BspA family leucine-rich repeat surface protein [archaeon]|nr:MAG: BspA family leucine-rich repeat surface protein [archaeon]